MQTAIALTHTERANTGGERQGLNVLTGKALEGTLGEGGAFKPRATRFVSIAQMRNEPSIHHNHTCELFKSLAA